MHEALPLPLAMLIVFGSAKLLAEICERLGQPGLVGEILAGALVGPSALGWITPNDTLKALSDLGVMFLLFGVGLEVKASEVLKVGAKATLVAILGVIVPFFAGWGIMSAWGVHKSRPFLSALPWWPPVSASPRPCFPPSAFCMKSPVRLFWQPRSLTTCLA